MARKTVQEALNAGDKVASLKPKPTVTVSKSLARPKPKEEVTVSKSLGSKFKKGGMVKGKR